MVLIYEHNVIKITVLNVTIILWHVLCLGVIIVLLTLEYTVNTSYEYSHDITFKLAKLAGLISIQYF
jgi:hypothetical protein